MTQRLLPFLALALLAPSIRAGEKETKEFTRSTIDLGVVVSDVEKSAKFYTQAIGFSEIKGFSVPGDFCKNAGLTSGKGLTIRVFVLKNEGSATRLKLMSVPGVKSKKSNNKTIHNQLGFSYITIHISNTKAALARLKEAGVKPIAKGPVAIPGTKALLTVVRDPDGNLVELVGP